jgi:hypothetical protein
MGFWDNLLPDTSGIAKEELEQPAQPELPVPTAQTGKQLPRNQEKPGGGSTYSASVAPSGRVKTTQMMKQSSSNNPMIDVDSIMSPKTYSKNPNESGFVHAPDIQRAYGIEQSKPGWGSQLAKAGTQLFKGITPVIAGGMMGGKKGALAAWQGGMESRQAEEMQRQKQTEDVSSDKTMREAYEIARMNYEQDYNMGKTDRPFGDYLAEAIEAIGTKYSGMLGQLQQTYGMEEGVGKMMDMNASKRGTGTSSGQVTVLEYDPITGRQYRYKQAPSEIPTLGTGTGPIVQTTKSPTGAQIRQNTGRPKASDF